jgi:hypothetical protein
MKQHRAIFIRNDWRDFSRKRNIYRSNKLKTNALEDALPYYEKVLFDWVTEY